MRSRTLCNDMTREKKDFQPLTFLSQLGFVQMWGHHWSYKILQVPAVVLAAVLLLSVARLNLFSFLLMKINSNERTPGRVERNSIYVSKLCSPAL